MAERMYRRDEDEDDESIFGGYKDVDRFQRRVLNRDDERERLSKRMESLNILTKRRDDKHRGHKIKERRSMASKREGNSDAEIQTRKQIVVAAIDFGTTYSGYAFSFKHEYEADSLTIHANEWRNVAQGQMNVKTPTCLLLHPDKKLHSFGHEAKAKYMALSLENQQRDWYFFWEFKMKLHQEKEIKCNFKLEDENGKLLDALTVFSLSIKFLKDHLMQVLKTGFQGVNDNDVLWVITVPAIWNDSAKKFMRQAAIQAGINKDCIEIALEPEAASIYCMKLPITRDPQIPAGMTQFPPGTRYMILDCGGGTVDVTVHEVLEDGNLKELHKATGGHCGGTIVNKDFLKFVKSLVSTEVFDEFSKSDGTKSDYLEFLEEFESKKRMTKPDSSDVVTIRIPVGLQELFRQALHQPLDENAIRSTYKGKVSILGDKLRISANIFKGFFKSVVGDIVAHVQDLLESLPLPVKAILMVGGFSESPVLQKAVQDAFNRRLEKGVIIPVDASLCILKGAVLYGHKPSNITERQCRYTYGVAMVQPFNKRNHPVSKQIEIDGELLCNDLFDKHVEVGQAVKSGTAQAQKVYQAMSPTDTIFPIVIYKSSEKNPKFIDDRGCEYVGCFIVKRPSSGQGRFASDTINVRFVFGNSDIEVEAIGEDGRIWKADFKLYA